MKFSQVILFTALLAGLAGGCTRRVKNITPMPNGQRIGGGSANLDPTGKILPGDGPIVGNVPNNPIGRGTPLNPSRIPIGTDLNNPNDPRRTGLIDNDPNPRSNPNPRGDTALRPRTDYESWPRDPDILRGNTIFFDTDKSIVKRSETAKVAIIADYLMKHPGHMVMIEGHADERGTEEYNRALGERRALGVREMLLNLGVPSDSVVTATFGEDRPAELGHNEAAWAKNRRGEPVVLIPPGSTR